MAASASRAGAVPALPRPPAMKNGAARTATQEPRRPRANRGVQKASGPNSAEVGRDATRAGGPVQSHSHPGAGR